jgi:ribosomal protein RSM22 (predicted rRNA methylase)
MRTIITVCIISLVSLFSGCKTNSITGRSQLDLVPESELQTMALTEYRDFLSKNPVAQATDQNQEMVRRVGNRISTAITKYYNDHGAGDQLHCNTPGNSISLQVRK